MSQTTLAKASSISRSVLVDFENEHRIPNRNNLTAIQRALEAAGVEFIDGDPTSVRMKKKRR